MIVENIDWQITSYCNRTCPYCFGPNHYNNISISDAKRVVDWLTQIGVKQIGLTGGEPLLYPNIVELIEYIYNKGIKIYLSTNCDYYNNYAELIKQKVAIIGIPLDGSKSIIHDSLRGEHSFINVKSALEDICNSNCNTKVKIGTVLTNINSLDLLNIERALVPYKMSLLYWKIYELIIYSKNESRAESLTTTYLNGYGNLGNYIGKKKIVIDSIDKRNRSYFFIKPNGDIFIPVLSHVFSYEKTIGNIFSDNINDICDEFNKNVDPIGYNDNIRYMKV